MNFVRGIDPKISLNLGIFKKIPQMMRNSTYDYQDFYEVWKWALEKKKNFLFPYLVSHHGKKWVNGEKVDISDPDYLWESVFEGNVEAVKALLTIPDLFPEEAFNLNQGTSELKDQYIERGHHTSPMRATNFGAYVNLASRYMHQNHPSEEIEVMLRDYYSKYSKE